MSNDVLAHLAMGVVALAVAGLSFARVKHWITPLNEAKLFGFILLAGGAFLYILLSGFTWPAAPYVASRDAATTQHFLIAELEITAGIILLLTARYRGAQLLIRAFCVTVIGIVLLAHAQTHHASHAAWLVPYHQGLAVLLFVAAAGFLGQLIKANKKLDWLVIAAVSVAGIMLVYYHDPSTLAGISDCPVSPKTIEVQIQNGAFHPATISASACDSIHFSSTDTERHLVAMGEHTHHSQYPGWADSLVMQGHGAYLIASEAGTYQLHDHLDDEITATLIIKPLK